MEDDDKLRNLATGAVRQSKESVFQPDPRLGGYRLQNLNGTLAIPRSPRRIVHVGELQQAFNGSQNRSRQVSVAQLSQRSGRSGTNKAGADIPKEGSINPMNGQLPVIIREDEDGVKQDGSEGDDDEDVAVDPTHLDPYLQALSVTHFQPRIFIKELCAHLFMPLTVLIYMWTHKGRLYLCNRSFLLGHNRVAVGVQWASFALFAYVHFVYFWIRPVHFHVSELIMFDVLYVIRFMVVSTKYAYVSPLEHREGVLSLESLGQMRDRQVITGWSLPTPMSIQTQILLASVRQKVDLDRCLLYGYEKSHQQQQHVNKHVPRMNQVALQLQERYDGLLDSKEAKVDKDSKPEIRQSAQLGANELENKAETNNRTDDERDEVYKVNAFDLAYSLIQASQEIKVDFTAVNVVTLLHCLTPSIVRLIEGKPWAWDNNWYCYIAVVAHFYVNFFLMSSNFAFVVIAGMDIHRREFLQKRLNGILSDGYIIKPETFGKTDERVRLNMTHPNNVLAWWYMKLVLQDYGLQFFKRINAYTGLFSMFSMALVGFLIFGAIMPEVLDTTTVVLAILNAIVMFVAVTLVLVHGDETNHIRRVHATTIIHNRLDLESRITRIVALQQQSPEKAQKAALPSYVTQTKEILETLAHAVRFDNELYTVRILGFAASTDLIRAVFALSASGLAAGAKILFFD